MKFLHDVLWYVLFRLSLIPCNLELPSESYDVIMRTWCFFRISGEKICMDRHFSNISPTGLKFGPETPWSVLYPMLRVSLNLDLKKLLQLVMLKICQTRFWNFYPVYFCYPLSMLMLKISPNVNDPKNSLSENCKMACLKEPNQWSSTLILNVMDQIGK